MPGARVDKTPFYGMKNRCNILNAISCANLVSYSTATRPSPRPLRLKNAIFHQIKNTFIRGQFCLWIFVSLSHPSDAP
jgi:hypothetical protein